LIASWKTSHKEHYRHSKSDANIFSLCPFLDYAYRPITDGVELFRAIRRHIVELVNHLPGAWDKSFTTTWSNLPEGKTFKVGDVIDFQNAHLERHVKQIRKTREKHGV
jgi:hypothetical protein